MTQKRATPKDPIARHNQALQELRHLTRLACTMFAGLEGEQRTFDLAMRVIRGVQIATLTACPTVHTGMVEQGELYFLQDGRIVRRVSTESGRNAIARTFPMQPARTLREAETSLVPLVVAWLKSQQLTGEARPAATVQFVAPNRWIRLR